MLSEGRWPHVSAISQFVPVQRLGEVLLEPGDILCNLLARGPGRDELNEGPEIACRLEASQRK